MNREKIEKITTCQIKVFVTTPLIPLREYIANAVCITDNIGKTLSFSIGDETITFDYDELKKKVGDTNE